MARTRTTNTKVAAPEPAPVVVETPAQAPQRTVGHAVGRTIDTVGHTIGHSAVSVVVGAKDVAFGAGKGIMQFFKDVNEGRKASHNAR